MFFVTEAAETPSFLAAPMKLPQSTTAAKIWRDWNLSIGSLLARIVAAGICDHDIVRFVRSHRMLPEKATQHNRGFLLGLGLRLTIPLPASAALA
jgi:hypothetical protein